MSRGKLIFVSGLTGAGKTTLINEALDSIDNLKALLTYTTRPMRIDEEDSHQYVFVDNEEYRLLKAGSNNWDETIYNNYAYASDAGKFIQDLKSGTHVIVSVIPNMDDIKRMAAIYETSPTTIWIDTPRQVATERVSKDPVRKARAEDESVKVQFDILFEPSGRLDEDRTRFIELIYHVIQS